MTVIEAQAPPAVGRDVEEVLRAGGLSSFHRKAILVTGVAWTFVAMEILLVGSVAPVFAGLWHLTAVMRGLDTSAARAGPLVGSLAPGRPSARIGRKRIFQSSILWSGVFTACTALSWGPWSVMTFRFLAGLGLGGMLVVDPSLLTEYLPPQRRGRLLVTLDLFWPLGLLLATGLSYVFLVQVGGAWSWRWLFLAASFPAFMAFVARLSLPESPFYLARKGRTEEAAAVLEQITGEPVRAEAITTPDEPRSSVKELFAPGLRRTSAVMVAVWIALNISYYGLFLWLPFVLEGEKSFQINVYLLLALAAVSQFPGYGAAIWLVERVGRKPTLVTV